MLKKIIVNILLKILKIINKDNSLEELQYLKKELDDTLSLKIEDYLSNRLLIDTSNGFQIKFLGEKIVRLLAKCFWMLVKDSENYLVFTFKDNDSGEGVDVILVKEGHLTPMEKIEELEKENSYLKEELSKYSS